MRISDKNGDGQVSYGEFKRSMFPLLLAQYPELFKLEEKEVGLSSSSVARTLLAGRAT